MATRVSAARLELASKPHALYRFYDRTDVLLYVGITVDIRARFTDHRDEKPWWTAAVRIEMEHFDTREQALAAEAEAIRSERPLYNVVHNELVRLPDETALMVWTNQAPTPEMITAEWLEANWHQIPATVRDVVEVSAHQGGAREFATQLADYFLDEELDHLRTAVLGDIDEDEEPPSAEDLVVAAVMRGVEEVTDNYRRLAREMESVFAQLPVERFRAARAAAILELRTKVHSCGDADVLWNTSRHLRRKTNREFLISLPPDERQDWIRAITNAQPYLLGDEVLDPAAELARRFKNTGAIPEGYCYGAGQHGTTCPEIASTVLTFAACVWCTASCAGHRISCELHLAVAGMTNNEFTDALDQNHKVTGWQSVEIDRDDPWNKF